MFDWKTKNKIVEVKPGTLFYWNGEMMMEVHQDCEDSVDLARKAVAGIDRDRIKEEIKSTKKITFETVDKNWQKDVERRLTALESNKPDNSNIIASVDEMVSLLSKDGMPSARTHIDHLLEIKERLEKKQ